MYVQSLVGVTKFTTEAFLFWDDVNLELIFPRTVGRGWSQEGCCLLCCRRHDRTFWLSAPWLADTVMTSARKRLVPPIICDWRFVSTW